MAIIYVLIALMALGLLVLGSSVRVITQFERGVVLRLGRLRASTRGPGLALIAPVVDRLHGCGGAAASARISGRSRSRPPSVARTYAASVTVRVTPRTSGEARWPSHASWSGPGWVLVRLRTTANRSPSAARGDKRPAPPGSRRGPGCGR